MKLTIGPGVEIDEQELAFSFDRSSGPGGQNVNKVSTRVTLRFDVRNSPSLTPDQKMRIAAAWPGRMSATGILQVISQRHRTQAANRHAAVERLAELVTGALTPKPPRKPTKPGPAARRRRLEAKRKRAQTKGRRAWRPGPTD